MSYTESIPPLDDEDLIDIEHGRSGNRADLDENAQAELKSELLSAVESGDRDSIFAVEVLTKAVSIRRIDYPFYVGPLAGKLKSLKMWGDWNGAVEHLDRNTDGAGGGVRERITLTQVLKALRNKSGGWHFAYDKFLEVVLVWPNGEIEERALEDEDITLVREHLERTIGEARASDVQDAIMVVARKTNSTQLYAG